jgi:hypothetical protein
MAKNYFTILFSNSGLLSTGMKSTILALLFLLVGCGGGINQHVAASASPTPVAHDVTNASVPAADLINQVGKTMHFTSGNGCHTDIAITNPPQGLVAGRGGVNVVLDYSKDRPDCYWNFGIAGAALQFVLHRNDDGESYRSIASLMDFPQGCPYTICAGKTNPVQLTIDAVDNDPSIPEGYQIVPPSLHGSQHIVFDTFVTGYSADGLTFDDVIPAGAPLGTSTGGEFWRTEYYIQWLDQPGFSGWAAVSEQWEDRCGHEKWYWANGLLIRVESPNDGINHECTPMDKSTTMVLTSVT